MLQRGRLKFSLGVALLLLEFDYQVEAEGKEVCNTAVQLMVSVCKLKFVGGKDILILCFKDV